MVSHLLKLWPCVRGRFNFLNLSRYSCYSERTLRRHFAKDFDWGTFNAKWMKAAVPASHSLVLAYDHSFITKSGRHTPGLSWFYNGCAQRTEKGLELALLAVVDLDANTAYALHAQQRIAPTKAPNDKEAICQDLRHLQACQGAWGTKMKHLVADGAFTRRSFVDGVCALDLEFVGKLRGDADMRYLFTGQQRGRGRPKLYDGKVLWSAFDAPRWQNEGELEKGVWLYSATLYHASLKRTLKVALLRKDAPAKGQVLLFSTDLHLSAREIVRIYRARFQIEFLFRDAKQGAGLTQCQSRNSQALHFHWNAALAALNVAKTHPPASSTTRFSWASTCLKSTNRHLLQLFSAKLGWDWNHVKAHPHFQSLVNYGAIAP
jgi:hypothetical protein